MILLLVLLSLAGSLARPQDVEFVTSLETAQDETITDNPIVGLELGASKVEEFIMLDDDLADGTDGSDGSTDRIPESLDTQEEDVTVFNDVIVDLNENIIADLEPSYVVKEEKILTLEITDYPEQSISFRSSSGPLGLNCDAHSLVDNDIKFMWTKNGRFIDTTAGHVIFEYQTNGNIIIFDPDSEDEGLYQCVASNSEGVVFSPVIKVKKISFQNSSNSFVENDRKPKTLDVAVYLPVSNNGQFAEAEQNVYLVMPASQPAGN